MRMLNHFKSYSARWKAYKENLRETNKLKYWTVDWIETIAVCLVLVFIIRTYIVQTSVVFSSSMYPTMQIGDRLFVNKLIYRLSHPHRGDIVLFYSPFHDGRQYVKRLVALPGEHVRIDKGVVSINGKPLFFPGVNVQPDYDYYAEVVVPKNAYFVLGDNRPNSADSRYWGFVPKSQLLGKAIFTFWPLPRMQMLH